MLLGSERKRALSDVKKAFSDKSVRASNAETDLVKQVKAIKSLLAAQRGILKHIDDFDIYLDALACNSERYLVVMTVNRGSFGEVIKALLREIGYDVEFPDDEDFVSLAIIAHDYRYTRMGKRQDEILTFVGEVSNIPIEVLCCKPKGHYKTRIEIGDTNLLFETDGMNILVFDRERGVVVDVVNYDKEEMRR